MFSKRYIPRRMRLSYETLSRRQKLSALLSEIARNNSTYLRELHQMAKVGFAICVYDLVRFI
jgi:predicted DNA-binding protein